MPWFALWPVPEYNFTQVFSSFCFGSLYIKPEVVSTLCAVSKECMGLMQSCNYVLKYHKAMKVDQFRLQQRNAITQMGKEIRDVWSGRIIKVILEDFENVGKGWFSIHETSSDTYREGKMKKLLTVIRFMMEDALRYFALDCVADYCTVMESFCPHTVKVEGLMSVQSEFSTRPLVKPAIRGDSLKLCPPGRVDPTAVPAPPPDADPDDPQDQLLKAGDGLFCLEVKAVEGSFQYSADGTAVIQVCSEILDTGLLSLSDVPQVEASIVPQLFRTAATKKTVNTLDPHNDWVSAQRGQLQVALQKAVPCLDEYLALFKSHLPLLELDPAAYVEEKAEAEISLEECKACIAEHVQAEKDLMNAIPEAKVVGLFEINCVEVRKLLAGKHKEIGTMLVDWLQRRYRDSCQEVIDNFNGIFAQLRKTPKDIEGVANMRDFMASVPSEVL